jgi:hypothetical protein
LTSDVNRPWYSACCASGDSIKPFVTSMTILPDQSCGTTPTSLKATDPTATRMISASTASLTVTALTIAPSSPSDSALREFDRTAFAGNYSEI